MNLKQQDIADQLGISRGTLYRVINGSPLVSEKTRERVQRQLAALNYVPNRAAQSLKSGRSYTIGVLGPARVRMANSVKLESIYQTAESLGYSVMVSYSDGSVEGDKKGINDLSSHMVDGIIVMGRGLEQSTEHFENYHKSGKPLVSIYPIQDLDCDCVTLNTANAFNKLTKHLIGLGHERIGLICFDLKESRFAKERVRGYRQALKAAGIEFDDSLMVYATPDLSEGQDVSHVEQLEDAEMDFASGFWGARHLIGLKNRPSALVCASDDTAIGAKRACFLAGLNVPDDIALVGYDNTIGSRYTNPPLTTVDQSSWSMGESAVQLLHERLSGALVSPDFVRISVRSKMVVRESCGAGRG